jgi:acetylornithine deacetylase
MDTVDVAGMTIDPFAAECRDGVLWGRGACDVKGTMAVMLTAMVDWYQRSRASSFNLIFIGTMGEEGGTLGAKAFCQTPEAIDMVLVGEPTSLQPVVAHKGLWRFAVETRGLSCHSSRPENGENAVENMLRIVQELDTSIKSRFESDRDNTLTYTMLHGGSMVNIVPDSCRLDVDARYHAETPIEQYVQEVRDLIHNHSRSKYISVQQEPAYQCRSDSSLLTMLEEALIDSHRTVERRREPWFSDAAHFAAAGYDTLLWGAGDIRYAHTADERIALEALNDAVTVLNRLLLICERKYGT